MPQNTEEEYKRFLNGGGVECFIRHEYIIPREKNVRTSIEYSKVPRLFQEVRLGKTTTTKFESGTVIGTSLFCMKGGKLLNEKEFEKEVGVKFGGGSGGSGGGGSGDSGEKN